MRKIKDSFIVKDNFFDKKTYDKILLDISKSSFTNRNTLITKEHQNAYQKIYFSVPLDLNHFAVKEIKNILKNMGFSLKSSEHNYFLSTKHKESTPHADWHCDVNCLVYLKGKHLVNSGTGFWDKFDENYILNSHVGFKENRAIIFDSKIYHASLQFNQNSNKRYVMVNFFKIKK